MGRSLRTRLDQLKPDIASRVREQQWNQKRQHDLHSRSRMLTVGDIVWVRNFCDGPTWISGTVVKVTGPVSYEVHVGHGEVWRRHIDHIRQGTPQSEPSEFTDPTELEASSEDPDNSSADTSSPGSDSSPNSSDLSSVAAGSDIRPAMEQPRYVRSPYPVRRRTPPDRYGH